MTINTIATFNQGMISWPSELRSKKNDIVRKNEGKCHKSNSNNSVALMTSFLYRRKRSKITYKRRGGLPVCLSVCLSVAYCISILIRVPE